MSIKGEVEVDEEEVKGCSKLLKGYNEAGSSATFDNCALIHSLKRLLIEL